MSQPKTDEQLVANGNELARKIYQQMGYIRSTGFRFDQSQHPQEQLMWMIACVAYEHIEGTDLNDALTSMEE